VDETYVKVAGQWRYVYRAIDQFWQVIDAYVSPQRDAKAAQRFFERAIRTTKIAPAEVTTRSSGPTTGVRSAAEVLEQALVDVDAPELANALDSQDLTVGQGRLGGRVGAAAARPASHRSGSTP
jgi:transposase-like protein